MKDLHKYADLMKELSDEDLFICLFVAVHITHYHCSAFKGYTLNLLENIYRKKLDVAVNAEKMVDSLCSFDLPSCCLLLAWFLLQECLELAVETYGWETKKRQKVA
ncbi:transmembrane protein, putative [Medicago truncatula]|uniref:Transmembrane protein, putative n=1 Tax=Medicago truncatula TaxID=3880 RepID=A0A072U062_MEDTR|nr:transmembrane protein, putative [Medicago truncatula]